MAINQKDFYIKAYSTIQSCKTTVQLPTADKVLQRYNQLQEFFEEDDMQYDHEWHMYKLLAVFNQKTQELS
jgi:hypothetical protein